MPRQLIAFYQNGNYVVKLYGDGTKEKITEEDSFKAEFPDSMDLKITNYCDMGCPMCHEMSSTEGEEGNLDEAFFSTLKKGTELAIGGGNPLSHKGLLDFLERMKSQGVICNITVNENHLCANKELISQLIEKKLIYGLGVSIKAYNKEVIEFAKRNKNVVLHVINGIFSDYGKIANQNLKILILGYKKFGRGTDFYSEEIEKNLKAAKENVGELFDKFRYVSFDNLALSQLEIHKVISKKAFDEIYMGDDGEGTMYVDLVKREFASSSTSTERFALKDDIISMFEIVKK